MLTKKLERTKWWLNHEIKSWEETFKKWNYGLLTDEEEIANILIESMQYEIPSSKYCRSNTCIT